MQGVKERDTERGEGVREEAGHAPTSHKLEGVGSGGGGVRWLNRGARGSGRHSVLLCHRWFL